LKHLAAVLVDTERVLALLVEALPPNQQSRWLLALHTL